MTLLNYKRTAKITLEQYQLNYSHTMKDVIDTFNDVNKNYEITRSIFPL